MDITIPEANITLKPRFTMKTMAVFHPIDELILNLSLTDIELIEINRQTESEYSALRLLYFVSQSQYDQLASQELGANV